MAKRILICIDGTALSSESAAPNYDRRGERKDESISNVLKLHLLAGGRLDGAPGCFSDQRSLYYSGVGTYGNRIIQSMSTAFALVEPELLCQRAYDDLVELWDPGDEVLLFGFSRGAAIVRMLAAQIDAIGLTDSRLTAVRAARRGDGPEKIPPVRLLGAWDTVATHGFPNVSEHQLPKSTAIRENGRIARCVEEAWHLVSLDEPRQVFRPTLMGHEPRVHEVWMAGVHSDVGGGYLDSRVSDVALMLMQTVAARHGVQFLRAEEIDYGNLGSDVELTLDDLRLDADSVGGLIHDAAFLDDDGQLPDRRGFAPRRAYVAVDDEPSDIPPLVYRTVLDRMAANEAYAPASFAALPAYRVLELDGTISGPYSSDGT